jgi:pimeloyl-ACP methyl ester carboxylesterase
MTVFAEGYWTSADGLRLHYRDYAGAATRAPLLCIAGLTRNARDFEPLVDLLGGKRRIIAVDLRGRGESAYATDPMSYAIPVYLQDVDLLLRALSLKSFIAVGTSLGGLVSMFLASTWNKQMKGLILNDVGPDIDAKGLDRIGNYVGQARNFDTWMHAARSLAEAQGAIYPDFRIEDWLRIAKRICKLSGNGRIIFDYDMKIAEPFKQAPSGAEPDLWPFYEALGTKPVLILRGEKSDILTKSVAAKMTRRLPNAKLVTVPRVGHAPSLEEEAAQQAIAEFVSSIR